ncbi:MAG TPA: PEP-CTERM sorting domain-containing protein [Lacipirellulaceae bacterium]|nr:PEP-CTERM sorting domain-containing protein [Lacipirellulaceae bacterium]
MTFYDNTQVTGNPVASNTNTSALVQQTNLGGGLGALGNKYLSLVDANNGSSNASIRYSVATTAYSQGTADEISVQFDFFQPNSGGQSLNLRLGQNANNLAGPDVFIANGDITVNQLNVATTSTNQYDPTQVNTLLLSVAGGKYSLSINGVIKLSNLDFRNAGVGIPEVGWFIGNTAVQTMYVDNILISNTSAIPEPASLSLLGLGGLALLRRRR